jgi:hypothetical protein
MVPGKGLEPRPRFLAYLCGFLRSLIADGSNLVPPPLRTKGTPVSAILETPPHRQTLPYSDTSLVCQRSPLNSVGWPPRIDQDLGRRTLVDERLWHVLWPNVAVGPVISTERTLIRRSGVRDLRASRRHGRGADGSPPSPRATGFPAAGGASFPARAEESAGRRRGSTSSSRRGRHRRRGRSARHPQERAWQKRPYVGRPPTYGR